MHLLTPTQKKSQHTKKLKFCTKKSNANAKKYSADVAALRDASLGQHTFEEPQLVVDALLLPNQGQQGGRAACFLSLSGVVGGEGGSLID